MNADDITLDQKITDEVLDSEVVTPFENIECMENKEDRRTTAIESKKVTGKEDTAMPDYVEIKMSREQLYNEIWEISVMGVAQKYNLPYAQLLKLCKEADIPIPPSGYWTKISFGKLVVKTPLPDSDTDIITLSNAKAPRASKMKAIEKDQVFIEKRETIDPSSSLAAVTSKEHKIEPSLITF